jgi:3-deoxy-7-phosphoheptulonate synthase
MVINTDDQRITSLRPLIPPAILIEDIPVDEPVSELITASRQAAARIFRGEDDRLVVVVGPCSIHDTTAAIDYAEELLKEARRFEDDLQIIMRVYFEKPRTVVGWKGLINDPYIDNTFQINKGLRMARGLLHELGEMGLPTATEFLDTIIPQFIADLVSWAAIGARTTESQIHRELASGLSMPVGFKNGTGGGVKIAVDGILSARHSHWFPSVTKQGVAAIFQTSGNQDSHVILRGGSRTGSNFDEDSIRETVELLEKAELPPYLMVDCSHANSGKDFRKQPEVAAELGRQISNGSQAIAGVMLESNLFEGRQDYEPGKAVFGQSITDACLSFKDTVPVLEQLAQSVQARRKK